MYLFKKLKREAEINQKCHQQRTARMSKISILTDGFPFTQSSLQGFQIVLPFSVKANLLSLSSPAVHTASGLVCTLASQLFPCYSPLWLFHPKQVLQSEAAAKPALAPSSLSNRILCDSFPQKVPVTFFSK